MATDDRDEALPRLEGVKSPLEGTAPGFFDFSFFKMQSRYVEPGAIWVIRRDKKTFQVLSREWVSDMAAVSAINEFLKKEFERAAERPSELLMQDESKHFGADE